MKRRFKFYLKLNLMSVVFIIVSFISVTLAWFAYSGLSKVSTDIGVKAWYIELKKDGETVSNDIVISLDDIYPGMETVDELVTINNLGDSNATIRYSISSARILDDPEDEYIVDDVIYTSDQVEDILSHDYPFHINISLSKRYALEKTGQSTFEVSVSWPLDSLDDELDSIWGTDAYNFRQSEESQLLQNPDYQIRPSIQVVLRVTAEQYLEEEDSSSDPNYNLGDSVLYDVVNNTTCPTVSSTCLETNIIDINNTLGDETVTLLPNPNTIYISDTYTNYSSALASLTSTWTVTSRALEVSDILNIVSRDITDSLLIRGGVSDSIIGNLTYNNRLVTELNKAIISSGYYKYINEKFDYLTASNCFWTSTNYDTTNGFAINSIDTIYSKIYPEQKNISCNIVPVIIVDKF